MRLRPFSRKTNSKAARSELAPELAADRDLATRLLEGDVDTLDIWLDRHLAVVYRYITHRIGPGREALAAELTRNTFLAARKELKRYVTPGKQQTPLRLRLLRIANRQIARNGKGVRAMEHQPTESEELSRLRSSLNGLPSKKAATLTLALAEELPAEQIASVLGVSLSSAMRLVRSALRAMPAMQVVEDDD